MTFTRTDFGAAVRFWTAGTAGVSASATDCSFCWGDMRVGNGPVLAHGSACHPELNRRIEEVARKARIGLQHEATPRHTGTDADSIFVTRGGIPTAVVSLPQRYMHSPAETVHLGDLDRIADLLFGEQSDA